MPQLGQTSDPLLPTPVSTEYEEDQPKAPLVNMGVSLSTARFLAPACFL